MSATHTPGPWHWYNNTLQPVEKDPDNSAVFSILDADGGYGFIESDHKATIAELDADRLLIAAAPELLMALRLVRGKHGCGALVLPPADLERVDSAIAKATGSKA